MMKTRARLRPFGALALGLLLWSAQAGALTGQEPLATHEPAGFSELTEMSFTDSLNAPHGDWGLANKRGKASIVVDSTAPYSPPYVGQMMYPPGHTGGNAPANWYAGPRISRLGSLQGDSLYVVYWLKVSSNWRGHRSGVNKVMFAARNESSAGPLYTSVQGSGSDRLRYQIRTQGLESKNYSGNQPSSDEIVRGRWHKLEHLFVLNSGDTAKNGVIKVWKDGELIMHHDAVLMWNSTKGGRWWDVVKWNPTYGGTGGVEVPETQYQWMDHLYVSGNDTR
jgi:hypothetical protein